MDNKVVDKQEAESSTDPQRTTSPQNDTRCDEAVGSSKHFYLSLRDSIYDDNELRKRRLLDLKRNIVDQLLQRKYISACLTKPVINCPDTRCTNLNSILDVVEHLVEVHCNIPRSVIQLDMNYKIPLVLKKLEYGRSHCVAVLLVPIVKLRNYDTPSDRSTMPLVVLATKINSYETFQSTGSVAEAVSTSAMKTINDDDLLMIWICGHVEAISSVIKLRNPTENATNLYSGRIHSITEINNNPNVVLSRGNCLLVAAHNFAGVTNDGKIPLEMEIILSVKEEDLTN